MSADETADPPRRYEIEPDPAWDWDDEVDGVLTVELSWAPDALAGRLETLVASPELVAALSREGLTGYTTGPARGYFDEQSDEAETGAAVPELVQFIVGEDPTADFFYQHTQGLVISERALTLLQPRCRNLTVQAAGSDKDD